MDAEFDANAFESDLDATISDGRKAFEGRYKDSLNQLLGLSREDIAKITPDTTSMQKYDELITVVKAASSANLAEAQLKQQIEKLGSVGITIAKKVPALASIFMV